MPKKQGQSKTGSWSTKVSISSHRRVFARAGREHYANRAAYDILVNKRLDELEEAEVLERPVAIPIPGPIDVSKITLPEVATQAVLRNGQPSQKSDRREFRRGRDREVERGGTAVCHRVDVRVAAQTEQSP